MTLPSRDSHSATLAGVLAGQLLTLSRKHEAGAISEAGYQLALYGLMGLAADLGLTAFVLRLLDPHDNGRYDA